MTAPTFALVVTAWSMVKSPAAVAAYSMALGFGLLLAGIYTLLGAGCTLVVASLPPLAFGCALAKGLTRAE